MIKTILFDYGGVISSTGNFFPWSKANADRFSMSFEELANCVVEDWAEAKVNKISSHEFWNRMGKRLKISPQELRKDILSTFPINPEVIELIKNLHEKYTTVLVSNQVQDWLEQVISENNLMNIFDYNISSYNTGFSKPDIRIFDEVIKRSKSNYKECLLIDDQTKNTNAVGALGMKAILYTSFEDLIKELDIQGVSVRNKKENK